MGILLAVALLPCSPASVQQTPKEMTFRSGRKVKIVSVQQIETKDATGLGSALWLQYETRLKITDAVGLRKEVDEIWAWLKVDAEHRKLKEAIIEIVEPPGVGPPQDVNRTKFIFKKQPDGYWRHTDVDAK
jgi:hypothetical protein